MRNPTFNRQAVVYDHKLKANVTVPVSVTVDIQALADHLGAKAYRNRSGKSAIQGGIIKAAVAK